MKPSLFLSAIFAAVVVTLVLNVDLVEGQSEELAHAAHSFIHKHTNETEDLNLDTWEAPEEMRRDFVYYHSGYDEDDRPIWVAEWGKWDIRKYVDAGGEKFKNYDRYMDQFMLRILQSVIKVRTPENPVAQIILIIDCKGLLIDQLSSAKSIVFNLQKLATWVPIIEGIGKGFIINTSYIAELVVNLVKPVLGRQFERFEVYGTNKAKWIPKILQECPKSQIPEWYGGSKTFKPVAVFG